MAVLRRQLGEPPTDPAYYTWTIQKQLTAIDLSLMILALITVLLRVYIRVFTLGVFRLDDYFMVAAMVCSVVSCSIFLHVIDLGMGKHIFVIPQDNIQPLLLWVWIVGLLIPIAVFFVKMSIAFFLLPLTRNTRYRAFLWTIVVFLVALIFFGFFTILLSCVPIKASWDFRMRPPPIGTGNAKCLSLRVFKIFAVFNTISNIITDFILALIPVPLIWTLQVNIQTKVSLIFVLSLGFFACGAGIVKAPLLYHFFDGIDITGSRSWYYAWQIIEMNVGIIAATLPSLKPLFRWLLETARSIATGASVNRTGASRAYRRQSSVGYLRHKEANIYASSDQSGRSRGHRNPNDMELKDIEPYEITVAGNESRDDIGIGSDASSEAIMRGDGQNPGQTRIVKTTKVTIVTSQSS